MNIFYLDHDIIKCAQAHCDKHVNKMILEAAQLLAAAHHVCNPEAEQLSSLYRLTHKNHPCAVWVRASRHHYCYVQDLMYELNEEAKYRYNRKADHLSFEKMLEWGIPPLLNTEFVDPPKCVHDDFKNVPGTVEAYRAYYKRDKASILQYTKRKPPDWLTD